MIRIISKQIYTYVYKISIDRLKFKGRLFKEDLKILEDVDKAAIDPPRQIFTKKADCREQRRKVMMVEEEETFESRHDSKSYLREVKGKSRFHGSKG